jgi:hypothetical protein
VTVTAEPSAVIDAELQNERQSLREQERERARRAGFPAWRVRVDVPSHGDVVALAGHLAALGWGVRRRRRHLFVGASCEDDAKSLVRELSGDGRADAEAAFRVGRVSYEFMLFDAVPTQVFGGQLLAAVQGERHRAGCGDRREIEMAALPASKVAGHRTAPSVTPNLVPSQV